MFVLVTGGAGYVGSHAAKVLAGRGITPVVYDNLSRGHRWAVRWGPFIEGDLADRDRIVETLRSYPFEAVMHFAAYALVGESVARPELYFRNNTGNTLNLLEAMCGTGVRRIVFSSTCATYGVPQTATLSEDHPQNPVNPYGDSKLFVERMLRWFGEAHRLQWTALRYFNAAGADPEGEIGECHDPETHLIPNAIDAALEGGGTLEVYGTDYSTPDGTAIRDYIHVTDLGDAHVRALEYLQRGGASAAFNLGTGKGHSVFEVIAAVESASGRKVRYRPAPRRAGDPAVLVANADKAFEVLSWTPRHSSLETIVRTAWDWRVVHRPKIAA